MLAVLLRLGRRLCNALLMGLAIVLVLTDDLFRAVVVPAVRALSRLAPVRWAEARVAALPPYGILALFLVPLAVIEPFKLLGLYLFATGHLAGGALTFVAAKVVGVGLAERLFAVGRGKLLSIRWFAWCHGRILAIRDRVHAWLLARAAWQRAMRWVEGVRAGIRATIRALRGALLRWSRRGGGRRLSAARRLLARRLARGGTAP